MEEIRIPSTHRSDEEIEVMSREIFKVSIRTYRVIEILVIIVFAIFAILRIWPMCIIYAAVFAFIEWTVHRKWPQFLEAGIALRRGVDEGSVMIINDEGICQKDSSGRVLLRIPKGDVLFYRKAPHYDVYFTKERIALAFSCEQEEQYGIYEKILEINPKIKGKKKR